MKILYDLLAVQPEGDSKFHGGGEYAKIVLKELVNNRTNQEVFGVYNKNKYLDEDIKQFCIENKIKLYAVNKIKEISNLLRENKFDKFYSAIPYGYHNIDIPQSVKFIMTIHGLRPMEMPTDLYEYKFEKGFRNLLKYIYKNLFRQSYIDKKVNQYRKVINKTNNRIIIVPSFHTKYSILNFFPEINPNEIKVLYSPSKSVDVPKSLPSVKKYNVESKKYFLLISANRWLKNNYRAILALDKIYSCYRDIEIKTLVLGANGLKFLTNVQNKDKFVFEGYVKQEDLESLYNNAYALVYPTLNEGFGYPPLEAMKYGTTVIASSTTSVTEICRSAILYFNPYSIDEIRTRILQVIFDDKLRYELSKSGILRYKEIAIEQEKMLATLCKIILSDDN